VAIVAGDVDPIRELTDGRTAFVSACARAAAFCMAGALTFEGPDLNMTAGLRRQLNQTGSLVYGLIFPSRN
jgi:hypothetical protein